jgi:hypothetical protein
MIDRVTDDPTLEHLEQLARSVAMSGTFGDGDRLDVMAACAGSRTSNRRRADTRRTGDDGTIGIAATTAPTRAVQVLERCPRKTTPRRHLPASTSIVCRRLVTLRRTKLLPKCYGAENERSPGRRLMASDQGLIRRAGEIRTPDLLSPRQAR